jgi:hypothetical protein
MPATWALLRAVSGEESDGPASGNVASAAPELGGVDLISICRYRWYRESGIGA